MLGWSPRKSNRSSMSLAAAPSSHSCTRAICEQCWVDERCKVTCYLAQPGAPCTPGGRSPSTTSRCLHRRKAVTYFCMGISENRALYLSKSLNVLMMLWCPYIDSCLGLGTRTASGPRSPPWSTPALWRASTSFGVTAGDTWRPSTKYRQCISSRLATSKDKQHDKNFPIAELRHSEEGSAHSLKTAATSWQRRIKCFLTT